MTALVLGTIGIVLGFAAREFWYLALRSWGVKRRARRALARFIANLNTSST